MKTTFLKAIKLLLGLLSLTFAIYGVLVLSFSDNPAGRFHGYEFYGHHGADLLHFEKGKVTLKTCCGSEDFGTYSRDATGRWIWNHEIWMSSRVHPTPRLVKSQRFILRRTFFGLTINSIDPPVMILSMRNRASERFPF